MTTVVVPAPDQQDSDLRMYRVSDVMRLLHLSRTVIYEQLRTGRLRSVQQGRARLIPSAAIRDYIRLLENEAREESR
jgi:excisionase family DNA binding protein